MHSKSHCDSLWPPRWTFSPPFGPIKKNMKIVVPGGVSNLTSAALGRGSGDLVKRLILRSACQKHRENVHLARWPKQGPLGKEDY